MMKTNLKVLFVSFLLMLLSTAPCLAADTAVVTGETLTVVTGETIEYRVSISGNPGITGLGLKLSFDTDALALSYTDGEIDCVQGDFSGRGSLYCGPTADGCQILWSHTSDVATDGTLFTLRLTVKEDAIPGEYPIRIQNVSRNTVNKAEERVPLTCRSGSITVRTYQQLIYGESVTALQGDEFSFSVSLQDNPGIASCDISVQFDPEVLIPLADAESGEYAAAPTAGILGGSLISRAGADSIRVFWTSTDNVSEDGTLFTLRFQVKDFAAVGRSSIILSYSTGNTLNAQEQPVTFDTASGEVDVRSALTVDVQFQTVHAARITVTHTSARNIIAAFYDERGKMLTCHLEQITSNDVVFSVQSAFRDLSCAEIRIMFLDEDFRPLCEAYPTKD